MSAERSGGEAGYMGIEVEGTAVDVYRRDTTIEELDQEVMDRGGKPSAIVPPEMRERINELKPKEQNDTLDEYEAQEYYGLTETAGKMLEKWLREHSKMDKAA